MKKNLGLYFLFFIISSTAIGQTQKLILTREQNNKWLDSFKILALEQQLIEIKERLLSDTNVFVRQFYNDRIRVDDQLGNRAYGDGKPTLIIDLCQMVIDNKTETSKIIRLTELLNSSIVKSMNILNPKDPATTAVYGSAGMSGIIVIGLKNKKHLKKFRLLNLK